MASAKLVADPVTTDPLATGPAATPAGAPAATPPPPPLTTSTTSPSTTTTRPATTTKPAATTTAIGTTTATTATTTTPSLAETTVASGLVISGHGWGHGVGMAQWGANGYAQHGWDYRQILAHYYQGTTVATHSAPAVRVLLVGGRSRVTRASASAWKGVDAQGTSVALPAGALEGAADLVVSGRTLSSPLTFSPRTTPLRFGQSSFRGTAL